MIYAATQIAFTRSCQAPKILFDWSGQSQPNLIAEELIAQHGGLPKTGIDLSVSQTNKPQFYPVGLWHVPTSTATSNSFFWTVDDDPTYLHEFDIYVTYQDGDLAVIRWSSWRYGRLLCPFVISLGNGPPGRLDVISFAIPSGE